MRARRRNLLLVAAIAVLSVAALSVAAVGEASAQIRKSGFRGGIHKSNAGVRPAKLNAGVHKPKMNRVAAPVKRKHIKPVRSVVAKTPSHSKTVVNTGKPKPKTGDAYVPPRGKGGDHKPHGPVRGPGPVGIGVGVPGILPTAPINSGPGLPPRSLASASPSNNPGAASPAPQQNQNRTARRSGSGAPPAGERRLIPDQVVVEVANTISPQNIAALERRHRLTRLEQQSFQLTGTTLIRWRIADRRSVAVVVRALEADGSGTIASAQPNYLFALQQQAEPVKATEGEPSQYALTKLRLPLAHEITKGANILVAVIDSGVDTSHPELAGVIAGTFDTLDPAEKPHAHGTGIAGLIAANARLRGVAPAARILAVRAFGAAGSSAQATTFNVLRGLDWSAARGARVINMSFAGPADPAIARSLAAAAKKGIVLIAAAGNAGAKSPPLYPAADSNVIAVTATDSEDKLFAASNRGRHIAVAAPGVDILAPAPDAGYQVSSGTSMAAAEVSGVVALMLARKPNLTPHAVRAILLSTARDLGPKGRDDQFGAGLTDAYQAIMAAEPVAEAAAQPAPDKK